MNFFELGIVLLFLLVFSIISFKKNLLNFEGIILANVVGLTSIVYGPSNTTLLRFFAVVVFFIIGEIASNFPKKKHEQRGIWNVVGNSLPALFVLSLMMIFPEYELFFELGFFGAIAAALSDTLSSEVGYYSKKKPIMITTLKEVPRGTDGGVSVLGLVAGFFGAIIIASIHFLFYSNFYFFVIIVLSGLVGTIVDSLFGAVFENKKLLNNTQVNLIGCSSGALFALLAWFFI